MRNSTICRGVVAVLAVAICIAPALAAQKQVTWGEFGVEIAKARNVASSDAQTAWSSLEAEGVRLPNVDLGARMTQRDVVQLSELIGINLTSSTPDEAFTSDQMRAFMVSFAPEISGDTGGQTEAGGTDVPGKGNGADPRTKGKGKKKGLYKSPSEPL